MNEIDAINSMAMDQISRMDSTKKVEVPPVISQKANFWGTNNDVAKYRPSEQQTSFIPRSYYSSNLSLGYSNMSTMESYYKRVLNAVYKQEKIEQPPEPQQGGHIELVNSLSLFNEMEPIKYAAKKPVTSNMSHDAKNQMLAIVLSGITKVATTIVLNWARERRVPYELL